MLAGGGRWCGKVQILCLVLSCPVCSLYLGVVVLFYGQSMPYGWFGVVIVFGVLVYLRLVVAPTPTTIECAVRVVVLDAVFTHPRILHTHWL